MLRIRREQQVFLTYKDGTRIEDGAVDRRELELAVDDFETAMQLVRALDFEIVFIYEKYRTTFERSNTKIMLDELPFGSFAEIEGEIGPIRAAASQLGLDWGAAIARSYHALFDDLRRSRSLSMRDLTFETMAGLDIAAADLGVGAADQ